VYDSLQSAPSNELAFGKIKMLENQAATPLPSPVSSPVLSPRTVRNVLGERLRRVQWRQVGQFYLHRRRACLYAFSALLVTASFLLWFNFRSPPINSNIGFNLYPWRQVGAALSPFDPYVWPGTYTPWTLGVPTELYYGSFYTVAGNNYAVALFGSVVLISAIGGACLCYLLIAWLERFAIRPEYALIGVLAFAFNDYKLLSGYGTTDGFYSSGLFLATDPAILVTLAFLTFLAIFRDIRYSLLLGVFSFFAFSNFPTATLILLQEYFVFLILALAFRWSTLRTLRPRERLRSLAGTGLAIVAAIGAANAYLLYPFDLVYRSYSSALSSTNPAYAFSYGFDVNQTLPNAMRLITNWSVFTQKTPPWAIAYLTDPLPIVLSFLLPGLALAAVLFLRRPSELLLYSLMLVGAWVSASITTPTGTLFQWFTSSVPPFRAFYNGETLSPVVLLFYCIFAPITVAKTVPILGEFKDRFVWWTAAGTPSSQSVPKGTAPAHRFTAARVWPFLISGLLLISVAPALTTGFSADHASAYPVDSSLPSYYEDAARYLQTTAPSAATMVFPEVQPFDSNSVNGTTWYYGVNLYPNLISNPTISSEYPINFVGGAGSTLPVAGLVYGLGRAVCASTTCLDEGVSPVPTPVALEGHSGTEFATSNASRVNWLPGLPSDNVTFAGTGTNETISFQVNSSPYQQNGHWLIGFLHPSLNLSADAYALVNYSLEGASPQSIQFGYHSTTEYGAGSGYYLGNFTNFDFGTYRLALVPLGQPSILDNGTLTSVTNLFFVDDSQNRTGLVTLQIHSLRLIPAVRDLAPIWSAGTPEDRVVVGGRGTNSTLEMTVNASVYEPNGHWMLGYFPAETNLSSMGFAVLNYTCVNIDPNFLQFGFHSSSEFDNGSGYPLSDYLRYHSGNQFTSVVPLPIPTLQDNGSLDGVTNLFVVYSPPPFETGTGFLNITSLKLTAGDPQPGLALASALNRLGVEFAYVDTSIVYTNYQEVAGDYYNTLFGSSDYFVRVFHDGTVTIYRDLLYSGVIDSPTAVEPLLPTTAAIGNLSSPYSAVYYNASNSGIAYISGVGADARATYTQADLSNISAISPTEYTLSATVAGQAVVELKAPFDLGWVATYENGTLLADHFEVDGYANGWALPPGSYELILTFRGAQTYASVELATFALPPALLAGFLVMWFGKRRASQRRLLAVGTETHD
jgi:hypothetical protein